ncbi:beta-glucosidase [Cerasicoccus arenae]|uniref:Beta-glucosidase n=2 Tax=Cerasicoccus arenae TaxID=424488 RepID=A0A8J3GEP0_9BACT|nr:beta-glucosidase [Cerasicoccus arenae]
MSVWDMMCQWPGKIYGGETGDDACEHYYRYREDVAEMKTIGLETYRFSVSWPRVLPDGIGKVNAKGLEFYDRLVDCLLEADIEPWVTLFHWDYPLALYQKGGWLNRDSVDWFGEYASVIGEALGDRVSHWMTLNEPQCFMGNGHLWGSHAPGDKLPMPLALKAMHHALMAHGNGVLALRKHCELKPKIGWAPNCSAAIPVSESAEDVETARKDFFKVSSGTFFNNSLWSDPVYLGRYPEEAAEVFGADWPDFDDGDMTLIAQPLDFIGYNCYSGYLIKASPNGGSESIAAVPGEPVGTLDWLKVMPDSLYWASRMFAERYGPKPIYITENGLCNTDWVSSDGAVHDPQRIDYISSYLQGVKRAVSEGIDVSGYFYWSIFDNFEWAEGYRSRFGLVHVDFGTQKRTLKDSAWWYRNLIQTNGESLDVKEYDVNLLVADPVR